MPERIDAYATAMLAAQVSYRSLGVLNFTCSLKRSGPESTRTWNLRRYQSRATLTQTR